MDKKITLSDVCDELYKHQKKIGRLSSKQTENQ